MSYEQKCAYASVYENFSWSRALIPLNTFLLSCTVKALSQKSVLDFSEKFQLTAFIKSFDSIHWQLHALQCGLVNCRHVVLLPRQGYRDFHEAGYKCGLLSFYGKVCAAGPLSAC